jgi:hypothetical protein
MPVSIIDMDDSNSANFLALFYQTQIYYANDPVTRGKFAYYWEPEVEERVCDEIRNMRKSDCCGPSSPLQKKDYGFLVGFKHNGFWKIFTKRGKTTRGNGPYDDYQCLVMKIYTLFDGDLASLENPSSLTEHVTNIFNNHIVVLIIDCSKFTKESNGERAEIQKKYDSGIAKIISSYISYRAEKGRKKRNCHSTFYPLIVMNKIDQLAPEILKEHELNQTLNLDDRVVGDNIVSQLKEINYYHSGRNTPSLQKSTNKQSISLMKNHMPETLAALESSKLERINSGKQMTKYFLSWTINKGIGEDERFKTSRLKYSNGQTYESCLYSRHMYIALIKQLREIATKSPDTSRDIAALINDILNQ